MEDELYVYLKSIDIPYEKVEHEAFPTCEESGDFYEERGMGILLI